MPTSFTTTIAGNGDRDSRGRALDDFQSKLNRGSYGDDRNRDRARNGDDRNGRGYPNDRDRGGPRGETGNGHAQNGKSWDAAPTPRSVRGGKEMDGGSLRVPNRGWNETPRAGRLPVPGGRGKAERSKRNMGWDQTPRSARGANRDSPDRDDGLDVGGKEWEEEQVRLDRDWYSHDDEGAVVSSLLLAYRQSKFPFSGWG